MHDNKSHKELSVKKDKSFLVSHHEEEKDEERNLIQQSLKVHEKKATEATPKNNSRKEIKAESSFENKFKQEDVSKKTEPTQSSMENVDSKNQKETLNTQTDQSVSGGVTIK